MTGAIRRKHLTLSMERSDCAWLSRYGDFIVGIPSHIPSEQKLERFCTALANRISPPARKIKRSMQSPVRVRPVLRSSTAEGGRSLTPPP